MPVIAPGASGASASPQQFLERVQAPAWQFVRLCGAVDRDPRLALERAMRGFCRRRGRRQEAAWPLLFWSLLAAESGQAAPGVVPGNAADPLQVRLLELPLAQRQAFLLRIWLGFEAAEIARMLHVPVQSVHADLYLALQSLRPRASATGRELDSGWLRAWRERLDRQAQQLPPPLVRELDLMRVDAAQRRRLHWPTARRPLGALLLAAGLLLMLAALPLGTPPSAPVAVPPPPLDKALSRPVEPLEQLLSLPAEDFALLEDDSDFELLADLEFYRWLQARRDAD